MQTTKIVTASIAVKHNRVLITRRASGQSLAGYWEFPGGKVEPGETLQDCLHRELLEELGVESIIGGVFAESLYDYAHGSIKLIGLSTELAHNDFILTVHDRADWVPFDQLLSYQLAPADIPIARKLLELIE